ncbi:MAG: hypothetical protein ACLQVI_08145 [Polyangiaceae bacterium]
MSLGEEILPFPAARAELVPPVSQVRGTWIAASYRGLGQQGLKDAYLAKLDPKYASIVANAAYENWLPVDVLVAHYAACEALQLPSFQLTALGAEATRLTQGSVVGMVAKLAGAVDITPWTVLPHLQRLWDRALVGGGLSVTKLGPKEARIEVVGFPVCRFRYCRIGMRGVLTGMIEMFCTKAHVTELPEWTDTSGAVKIAWA